MPADSKKRVWGRRLLRMTEELKEGWSFVGKNECDCLLAQEQKFELTLEVEDEERRSCSFFQIPKQRKFIVIQGPAPEMQHARIFPDGRSVDATI